MTNEELLKYAKKAGIKVQRGEEKEQEDPKKKKAREVARESFLKGVSKGFRGN